MSRALADKAMLPDFDGPIEAIPLSYLHFVLDSERPNGDTIERAAATVQGHMGKFQAVTTDGYDWFCAHRFQTGSGEVAILFPWNQDWGRKDLSQADRSVGVYTHGKVAKAEIESILRDLGWAILHVDRHKERAVSCS